MKKGLVMEGGAMRGMFTAGVIDVFLEEGICFDGAVGVSAGATFGCNFKSRQIGRAIRYNIRFAKDPRFGSFRSLLASGDYYNADFCYHKVPEELDPFDYEAFRENPMRFFVVATSVETGRPAYRELTDCGERDMKWMQASASMPVFAQPVKIDGKAYLDGGISDSIPLRFMEHLGYEKNVVVLTRPADYRKKSGLAPGMEQLLKKYPAILEGMKKRGSRYNSTLAYIHEQEAAGKIFVIRPEEALPVSRIEHDAAKLQEAYERGRARASEQLEALKDFLRIRKERK